MAKLNKKEKKLNKAQYKEPIKFEPSPKFVIEKFEPATLPLKRFLTARKCEFKNDLSRNEAIELISTFGFSVDELDRITKDEE